MIPRILLLDCTGGICVGIAVLGMCQLLSELEGLPLSVVILMGVANLVYGGYSLLVATRQNRTINMIGLLAFANMAWLLVCLAIAAAYRTEITVLGLLHVLGEGVYVAGLGYTEWRMRRTLTGQ